MRIALILGLSLCLLSAPRPAWAQKDQVVVGDKKAPPILRLQAGGPTTYITSLVFSPDGRTLYAAGWDKVVRIWENKDGAWQEKPALRVPLGPGVDGSINALALSQDGNWLAVAGTAVIRSRAPFDQRGLHLIIPQWTNAEDLKDQGVIYVFDTRTREGRVLRGHQGPVWALAFAPPPTAGQGKAGAGKDEPPPLVSAAQQFVDATSQKVGALWLWDVAKGTHREWPQPLPDMMDPKLELVGRPGMAVWRSLQQPERLQVGTAWQDGVFRFWDIAEAGGAGNAKTEKDAKSNITLLPVRSQQKILTGGFRGKGGYLQVWNLPGLQQAMQVPKADGQTSYAPLAMASFPGPGNQLDYAAVVLLAVKNEKQEFRLHLLDLGPKSFGVIKADIGLWPDGDRLPTLAAASNGSYLAVAGKSGHEIWVYAVGELFTKGNAKPLKLASVGTTFRHAAFVKGESGSGLVLNKEARKDAAPRAGDLIFDFSRPGATNGIKGWQLDVADRAGWDVRLANAKEAQGGARQVVEVLAKGKTTRIELQPKDEVTAWALLPPGKPSNVPILALASKQASEPKLVLYDAQSGAEVRHLTGHDALIHCLAFSSDGRMLVSAAEDQTVCVWSMTDFAKVWKEHGRIAGLTVMNAQGAVNVEKVESDSPAAGLLKAGDVLEEVDKVQRLESALQFYQTVWDKKPGAGQKVALKVKGKGTVQLPVDQGIDERFPLLTLFVTQAAKPENGEWIAWHPQGPYAVSSEKAERYLGWHINTGKTDQPVDFAGAAKYRGDYYKPNILKELIAKGDLESVREVPPTLSDPTVFVQIGEEFLDPSRADKEGRLRIRPRQRQLKVTVLNFPMDKISGLEWKIDDGEARQFGPPVGREWFADLPSTWKAGEHTVRVVVHTPEGPLPAYPKEFKVLYQPYQPPPPTVTTDLPARATVKDLTFLLKAKVRPGVPNQEVDVTLYLNDNKPIRLKGMPTAEELVIEEKLELRTNLNTVKIEAINKNALMGNEAAETARRVLEIVYDPQKPQIVLEEIVPLEGGKAKGPALKVQPGEDPVVEVAKIRMHGKMISTTEKLTQATQDGRQLPSLKAEGFAIDEEINLVPGANVLTFRAATKNTEETKVLKVYYRPPLPRPVLEPPEQKLVHYDEGQGPPKVTLTYRLVTPTDQNALNGLVAAARINGKKAPLPPALDLKALKLTFSFTPETRDSQVQVQLSSPWREEPVNSKVVSVEYLRVPFGLAFVQPPQQSMEPVISLKAQLRSPLPLRPEWVDATVDGNKIARVELTQGKGDTWTVLLKDVSLNEAAGSAIRLRVGNEDGYGRQTAACQIAYLGKPPNRPDVILQAPEVATEPEITVVLRVRSDGPLQRIALAGDGDKSAQLIDVSKLKLAEGEELKLRLQLAPFTVSLPFLDVATLKQSGDGYLEGKAALTLKPGLNVLHLKAANEGGETSASAVVNYFRAPPVRVALDTLETDGQKPIEIEVRADGQIKQQAPQGRVLLTGRVLWNSAKDQRLKAVQTVQVRVNGFLQTSEVALDKPAANNPRERRFQVPLFLTKAAGNLVQIDFPAPDLPLEDSARREFRLDCAKPVTEKRLLHVLIIGIGQKDGEKLPEHVLGALGAKPLRTGEFELPTFDKGKVYDPLIDTFDSVSTDDVLGRLMYINAVMSNVSHEGPTNHVVLVYYKGGEEVNRDGHYLVLKDKDTLESKSLEDRLAKVEGAPILLLDVLRRAGAEKLTEQEAASKDRIANQPPDSSIAVLRLAKLSGVPLVPDPSLMMAWNAAVSPPAQASRLSEVEMRINNWFQQLMKKTQGALLYDRNIPPSLADLVIGRLEKAR